MIVLVSSAFLCVVVPVAVVVVVAAAAAALAVAAATPRATAAATVAVAAATVAAAAMAAAATAAVAVWGVNNGRIHRRDINRAGHRITTNIMVATITRGCCSACVRIWRIMICRRMFRRSCVGPIRVCIGNCDMTCRGVRNKMVLVL